MKEAMMTRAKEAQNVAELMELAKAEHMELTEEKAQELFAQLHSEGEIADDELDSVAGGGCNGKASPAYAMGEIVAVRDSRRCYYCRSSNVFQITWVGDPKYYAAGVYDLCCIECKRKTEYVPESDIIGRVR